MTDLLYALGLALWTGVVVVVFAQVIPEVKRRQITAFLDAYDAAQRDEVRTGSDQASGTTKRRRPVGGRADQRAGWMIAAR